MPRIYIYTNINILVMNDFSVLWKYITKYPLPDSTHLVIFSGGVSYSKNSIEFQM